MLSWLANLAAACMRPVQRYARMSKDEDDPLLWSRDLDPHSIGEFSIAVVQANETIEDRSQVETAPDATFAGVYDGHGGPDAAQFVADHLFGHLLSKLRSPTSPFSCFFGFLCSINACCLI